MNTEEEEEEEEETPPVESMHNSRLFSKKFKKVATEEGRQKKIICIVHKGLMDSST
jgi:hypothetical protein